MPINRYDHTRDSEILSSHTVTHITFETLVVDIALAYRLNPCSVKTSRTNNLTHTPSLLH